MYNVQSITVETYIFRRDLSNGIYIYILIYFIFILCYHVKRKYELKSLIVYLKVYKNFKKTAFNIIRLQHSINKLFM